MELEREDQSRQERITRRQKQPEHKVAGYDIRDEEDHVGQSQPVTENDDVVRSQYPSMKSNQDRQHRGVQRRLNLSGFVEQPVTFTLGQRSSQDVVGGAVPSQIDRSFEAGNPAKRGQRGKNQRGDHIRSVEFHTLTFENTRFAGRGVRQQILDQGHEDRAQTPDLVGFPFSSSNEVISWPRLRASRPPVRSVPRTCARTPRPVPRSSCGFVSSGHRHA
jgi:hypothetical protein